MTIKVIGIGLNGAEGLSPNILSLIQSATVLVGGDRHLSYFPEHQGIKLKIQNLNSLISKIKEYQNKQENIVFLATGDPLFFGIGRFLLENFASSELSFYPHLSSVQIAFNALKIPWQDAKLVSIHGRNLEPLIKEMKNGAGKIAILTDMENSPQAIVNLYHQLSLPHHYQIWLCENVGAKNQKISLITDLTNEESLEKISSLNIVVLLKDKDIYKQIKSQNLPLIGLDDHLFLGFPDRPGLITKKEIRQLILGELGLQQHQIIWDVGAGTGSISVEMARFAHHSKIYAIEKSAIALNLIEKNCHNFGVYNVKIISGSAIKVLEKLPHPDRVFIGGSGGEMEEILTIINRRINRQGKVAIALATLENLNQAQSWFHEHGWDYKILHAQISRSLSIANMTRFNPLNPVYIISATPTN